MTPIVARRRTRRILGHLLVLTSASACVSSETVAGSTRVATVVVTAADSLEVGESARYTVRQFDVNGAAVVATSRVWTSTDTTIATVDQSGLVIGRGIGKAVIVASVDGKPGTAAVKVVIPAVASITLDRTADTIPQDSTLQLTAILRDKRGAVVTGRALTWTSSQQGVAIVSSTGSVRTNAIGTAAISVASEGQSRSATITVLGKFTALALGATHNSCALTSAGEAWCWGANLYGALGNGSDVDSPVPTRVIGGLRFVRLSSGADYSCGLTDTGTAYCWGDASSGQLGNGQFGGVSYSPQPVAVSGAHVFQSITAGYGRTCAVDTGGATWCWGWPKFSAELQANSIPVLQSPAYSLQTLVLGESGNSCGLNAVGNAYCWGSNSFGQLGTGDTMTVTVPTAVAGAHVFVKLAAGYLMTCGLTPVSTVYCWGIGVNPNAVRQLTPFRMGTGVENFVSITAGSSHACALTATGQAQCWGSGQFGKTGRQFGGDGGPYPIDADLRFTALQAAPNRTCGIATNRLTYCWGDSSYLGALSTSINGALGTGAIPLDGGSFTSRATLVLFK